MTDARHAKLTDGMVPIGIESTWGISLDLRRDPADGYWRVWLDVDPCEMGPSEKNSLVLSAGLSKRLAVTEAVSALRNLLGIAEHALTRPLAKE